MVYTIVMIVLRTSMYSIDEFCLLYSTIASELYSDRSEEAGGDCI